MRKAINQCYLTILVLAIVACSQKTGNVNQRLNDTIPIDQNKTTRTEKPNVIIIFMDDMCYGDISSFGHPTIKTPHIDRLATEGQKWTNFYTASSVCSPSRGALLTGRYPIRIGLGPIKKRVFFPDSNPICFET